MLSDKEIKKKYAKIFPEQADVFYPTDYLKGMGFTRGKCAKCGKHFWNTDAGRKICGDAACGGEFTFLKKKIAKNSIDYLNVWKTFSHHLKKQGYTPIKRYPVVARWRNDLPFVEASIDNFIPYVVNGVVKPPANALTVPQFSLRFNDIGNVGITGGHYTGFVMIGQHKFEKPENYDTGLYLEQLSDYFYNVVGIGKKDMTYHEGVWAGSGNFGPCVELFSGGIELCNQVYMQFKSTPSGYADLKLKVLDLGLGQERVAWFSSRAPISYESTFPIVIRKLKKATGVKISTKVMRDFYPLAGRLNSDETSDLEGAWRSISKELGVSVKKLKETVLPLQAIYSVADHTRSLLFALGDGGLPSNSGGGYNLRVIYRRAYDFIKKYEWDVDFEEVAGWHAKELKKQYPELVENLEDVKRILSVEKAKYDKTRQKIRGIVRGIKGSVNVDKMIELYDSKGVTPEVLREEGVNVDLPDDFYSRIAEKHRRTEEKIEEKMFELGDMPKTRKLYVNNYKKTKFTAKVLEIIGKEFVVLDKTVFYPTSGGQDHDVGSINGNKVLEVLTQDGVILHRMEKIRFRTGDTVKGEVDKDRRVQLTQHHTAVHIVNGAARKVLGNHVWQGGASKTLDKARLDISHYESLGLEQMREIEKLANRIVSRKVPVESFVLEKSEAEKRYGFRLYQGGAIPGSELRIIRIGKFDVEACGGTHLKNTSEAGAIKITGSSKIQDGVVRIEMKAGNAVKHYFEEILEQTNTLCRLLGCSHSKLPERVEELFKVWKKARKGRDAIFKRRAYKEAEYSSFKEMQKVERALDEACAVIRVQRGQAHRTVERFLNDLKKKGKLE